MCPFAVRIPYGLSLAGFLGSRITSTINRPEGVMYFPVSTLKVDLPAFIDVYTVKRTIPSVRGSVTSPSPHRPIRKKRNFDRFSIGFAVRLILRVRLTPGRLTLPGKPWSIGERASHPLYRYLYLHLLFHKLQPKSSSTFNAGGMLPYRCLKTSRGFGYRFHTRLLSMRRPSTSELLRTL